jgi:hypothetical protein
MRPLLLIAIPFLCLGCAPEPKPRHQFEKALRDIAQTYEGFALVDASSRWALVDCAPPDSLPSPGDFHFSNSDDSPTHGRKMYVLFAKQMTADSYVADNSPVGQAIVKEAWVPEEVKDNGKLPSVKRNGKKVVPYAKKDGKLYHAAEKSALFIMFKMDPQTPDTDEGWVYGTVTPDGKSVTSAGRVESCMKCHQKAPHDKLFGLPADK